MKKIFLAGIIQGSSKDDSIHSQDYRREIISAVNGSFPNAVIFDPFEGHENSIEYDDELGKKTFLAAIDQIKNCDLMIAYLPHASLGTAIEIWECYKLGIPVWIITTMKANWVVRFCSEKVFENINTLGEYLRGIENRVLEEN